MQNSRFRRARPWFFLALVCFVVSFCARPASNFPGAGGPGGINQPGLGFPLPSGGDFGGSPSGPAPSGSDSGSWDWGGSDSGSWDSGGSDSGSWDSGGSDSGSWDSGGSDSGSW